MLTFEKLSRRPESFRRLTGVDIDLFSGMTEKMRPLREKRRNNFEKGGRKHNLRGVENHLLAMLLYYRYYMTYEFLSCFFDSDETTVMRAVKRVEKIAVQVIHIEKKHKVTRKDAEYLIIDATEQPVQRPKKADGGYQEIAAYDRPAEIPFKKPRNGELTAEQKAYNRNLSKKRIKVEHVTREVKVLKSCRKHTGTGLRGII